MFKKQFATKTEAPLRGSDRRKLKASVVAKFHLEPQQVNAGSAAPTSDSDDGIANLLVPEGIRSTKYTNSTGETGLLYISPDGDPLWFTEGDRNPEVVPSIYTLWKISLLPVITTAPVAIESLIGGSDLFIPGIFSVSSDAILSGALVSIASAYAPTIPLAVGKLLLDSKDIKEDEKGKAVHVLHTWKDALWQSGKKGDPPTDVPTLEALQKAHGGGTEASGGAADVSDITTQLEKTAISSTVEADPITAEDADIILRDALLQCLAKMHQSKQIPELPMPASTFYSSYILPNRRYTPSSASHAQQDLMKRSTHKKLSKFLEVYEKDGLFRLKKITKPSPDLLILSLNHAHAAVQAHNSNYRVVGEEEEKRERKERAGKEREEMTGKAVEVLELWKVHGKAVIALFDAFDTAAQRDKIMSPGEAAKAWPTLGDAPTQSQSDSSSPPPDSAPEAQPRRQQYYTAQDLISLLNAYIASENLVHPRDRKYVVVNDVLKSALFPAKPSKKGSAAPESSANDGEMFVTREELLPKLKTAMQGWYEVSKGGKEPVRKKGTVQPIEVKTVWRGVGRYATLISNFEPFLIDAETFAESLRHACAGATSVGPKEGGGTGIEVFVQGKHSKIAVDLLLAEGVPKKWIDTVDATSKKGKK